MSPLRTLLHCLLCLCLLLGAVGDGVARTMLTAPMPAVVESDPVPATSGGCHDAATDLPDHGLPGDAANCADEGDCTPHRTCDCACQHLLAAVLQQVWMAEVDAPAGRWIAAGSTAWHGPRPARLTRPPIG